MQSLKVGLLIGSPKLWEEAQACLHSLPVEVVLQQPGLRDLTAVLAQVDKLRPDVLLIDITDLAEPLDAIITKLKASAAPPAVIAVSTKAEPEIILGAIRAGASEFLYPPLEAGLSKALERLSADRDQAPPPPRRRNSGRTLAFLSGKGGCGATTIACHVAVEIQRATNQDVLLADLDMESGIVGFLMKSKSPYSIMDAVKNVHRLDRSYWKALVSNGQAHLEIISAPPAASLREPVDPQSLRRVIQFLRNTYQWVVIDAGRSINQLSLAMLEEIDDIFIVSTLEVPSLHQTKQVVQTLTEAGHSQPHLHLLMNRMPKRPDFFPAELKRALGLPIYETLPNNYPELYEAYAEGNLLPAGSELGKCMTGLAMKIAGIEVRDKPKSRLNVSLFSW